MSPNTPFSFYLAPKTDSLPPNNPLTATNKNGEYPNLLEEQKPFGPQTFHPFERLESKLKMLVIKHYLAAHPKRAFVQLPGTTSPVLVFWLRKAVELPALAQASKGLYRMVLDQYLATVRVEGLNQHSGVYWKSLVDKWSESGALKYIRELNVYVKGLRHSTPAGYSLVEAEVEVGMSLEEGVSMDLKGLRRFTCDANGNEIECQVRAKFWEELERDMEAPLAGVVAMYQKGEKQGQRRPFKAKFLLELGSFVYKSFRDWVLLGERSW